MKILVIGSGGREHALVWKLRQSPRVKKIYCAPGNAGIAELAECLDIGSSDIDKLLKFALENKIDMTVVGPEAPLTAGIVDVFEKKGLRIYGPSGKAAAMEGSKVFSKDLMKKYGIPSGAYEVFTKRGDALNYIARIDMPVVVKADGLAAGKGVIVAANREEAEKAVDLIMKDKAFGDAGKKIIIEEFLEGEEASFIAFTDGRTVLPLPTSQDHKAVYDGDKGPNTGGMGAYSPAPVVTEDLHRQAMEKVMIPTLKALAAEGIPYKGMLYAGLMIKEGKIKVLEFNCRFGDPEAQPLLMRLNTDLADIIDAAIDGRLDEIELDIDPRPTVCVVIAAGGYPGKYEKGKEIKGLKKASKIEDAVVFHAGTAKDGKKIVTSGGRVLGVTARGEDLRTAVDKAYEAVKCIKWKKCYYRSDIAHKALVRSGGGPLVGIVMGSDSDLSVMEAAADFLRKVGIPYEITVASAHRTPDRAGTYARTAKERGLKLIIAGAGMAAHLAGVLAAHTVLPVIGVPIDASSLKGLDSLLSTVQMPPGVPVATMGIGKSGAKNAGILAAQILALSDENIAGKIVDHKKEMEVQVEEKARKVMRA